MKQRAKKGLLIALLVFVMALNGACSAKEVLPLPAASVTPESVDRVFDPEISSERMLDTIKRLASKDNARITGFEGEASAADYLVEQYSSLGLEVSRQTFPLKSYFCDFIELKDLSDGERIIERVKALSFSAPTPEGGLVAEVVPLGTGGESEYNSVDVSGKAVLIQSGEEYFSVLTARAADKGAVAVLFYNPYNEDVLSASLLELSKIPAISITRSEGQAFEATFQSGKMISVSLHVDATHKDATSSNVIARLTSDSNPEGKRIIVGAHYDGVDTPAANDNASGAAVVLEMARALTDQGVKLPYDIDFIAFGAEEIGLIGANYYVNNMSQEDKDSVIAMINFDMVGVGDTFYIGYLDGYSAPKLIKTARETLNEMGYKAMLYASGGSDHAPFAQAGMDTVYIKVGPDNNYHTDLDTIDKIQPELLVEVCELGTQLVVFKIPEAMMSE